MSGEELLLRRCKFVLVGDGWVLRDVNVVVRDGVIASVGEEVDKSGLVLDCSDKVVIPGLVNSHTHAAMTLLRGYCDDAELFGWLKRIWRVEARLTPRIVYLASKLAIYEMLSSGTTAFVDMYFYPEETAKAAEELGIRAALGPPIIEGVGELEGSVARAKSFVKDFGRSRLIVPILNVHSIHACSRETLEAVAELSRELEVKVHIHVSETRREVFECKKKYGLFPVEYLDRLGVLSDRCILVHLGWVTSWEIELIREKGACVVHCPSSNTKLATAGFFPFKEMVRSGIAVGLGTDGPASNNTLDMIREMRMAVLLQRNNYWDVDVNAADAFRAATLNGGAILGVRVGSVEEGYLADLALLDAYSVRLQPLRADNLLSAIVYSASGADVVATVVGGRLVYDREDEEKIARWREEVRRIAEELNKFMASIAGQ